MAGAATGGVTGACACAASEVSSAAVVHSCAAVGDGFFAVGTVEVLGPQCGANECGEAACAAGESERTRQVKGGDMMDSGICSCSGVRNVQQIAVREHVGLFSGYSRVQCHLRCATEVGQSLAVVRG